MADTVIGSAVYQLDLDSSNFVEGATLTAQETRALRKNLRDIETPAEKFQKRFDMIQNLFNKGAMTAEQAQRAVDKLNKEMDELAQKSQKAVKPVQQAHHSIRNLGKESKNTTPWIKGLDQASQALGFNIGALGPAAVTVAASFAIWRTSMKAINFSIQEISKSAAAMDEVAKMAETVGIATDELIGMRVAASKLGGVTTEQFRTSMTQWGVRLSQAARGEGELSQALEALGMDAEKMAGDPTQALLDYADAVAATTDETQQLWLATRGFGEEGGAKMVTVLREGSRAIEDAAKQAERLNLTFSDDEAEKVQAMNDRISELQSAYRGFWNEVTIAVAENDRLQNSIEGLTKVVAAAPAMWELWGKQIGVTGDELRGFGSLITPGGQVYFALAELNKLTEKYIENNKKLRGDEKAPGSAPTKGFVGIPSGADMDAVRKLGESQGISFGPLADEIFSALEQEKEIADARYKREQDALDKEYQHELKMEQLHKEQAEREEKEREKRWKEIEKEIEKERKADEERQQRFERIGMGAVAVGSSEAFRLRREMNRRDKVQDVRIVEDDAGITDVEVEVIPGAVQGIQPGQQVA